MNKAQLISAIASDAGMKKTEVDRVLASFVNVVGEALADGEKVSLKGFGNFEVRERKGRTGRNPRTGELMEVAPSRSPAFKPSANLKRVINK